MEAMQFLEELSLAGESCLPFHCAVRDFCDCLIAQQFITFRNQRYLCVHKVAFNVLKHNKSTKRMYLLTRALFHRRTARKICGLAVIGV